MNQEECIRRRIHFANVVAFIDQRRRQPFLVNGIIPAFNLGQNHILTHQISDTLRIRWSKLVNTNHKWLLKLVSNCRLASQIDLKTSARNLFVE